MLQIKSGSQAEVVLRARLLRRRLARQAEVHRNGEVQILPLNLEALLGLEKGR